MKVNGFEIAYKAKVTCNYNTREVGASLDVTLDEGETHEAFEQTYDLLKRNIERKIAECAVEMQGRPKQR
jgi:hypothetical protein